ncbi:PREDICTED: regulator of G-protein signaling protein-like, partial [Apaloderma vittatum]|uniref:regulator of G-protein signaling protein-like n=1 Tax=Apaloderma vittatum TaxID=57397 RepID=UPI0005215FC4
MATLRHSNMAATATIASMGMGLLLRDDVFVDFFNTFLNLPVFGQTPIYNSSTGRWDLWPELQSCLDPSPPSLLAWLVKHRLPHFCKSSLCLHLVLCQKLLSFIRSQEAGEELTNFWLTTERLLGLDELDARQRDLYPSLLHRLKATHLHEGSSVMSLCRNIVGLPPKTGHVQPISTRREILSKMQEEALFKIQSYWLPRFFIYCKKSIKKEKSCWPLLQEYRELLLQAKPQEPSGLSESPFTMHIGRGQGLSGSYCSKKAKAEIWTAIKEGRNTPKMKMLGFQVQPGPGGSMRELHLDKDALGSIPQHLDHPSDTAFGGKGGATSPKGPRPNAEQVLPLKGLYEEKDLSSLRSPAPLVQLPCSRKPVETLSFLPWALSAETCAGRPFRDFLKRQDRSVETRLLDLWHDLEEFLPIVLEPSKENSFILRHWMGEKICKTYLEEGNIQQLPLETRTLRTLRNHLMTGEFSPWIFRAQQEICEVLCCFYEDFLADDDRTFLQFMSSQSDVLMPEVQGHAVGKDECFLLSQRMNTSLKLSQALHGTRNLEGLSPEHWQLIASRDLRKGGSIQAEVELLRRIAVADSQKMMFNELAVQKPPLAVYTPRKEDELWFLRSPSVAKKKRKMKAARKTKSSTTKINTVAVEKPSTRPRHFVKVLHNPAHLQFFMQFLKERNADKPLHFWMAVEKLISKTSPKKKNFLIDSIVRTYFQAEIPAEDQLDCHASIIEEISEAERVTSNMLITAQVFVEKAMEKRWFKEYQDLFPPSDTGKPNLHLKHRMGKFVTGKMRWAWFALRDLVKSLCKFRREMDISKHRIEFEDFLRRELRNKEENLPIRRMQSTSTLNSLQASTSTRQDREVQLVKRYLFDSQLITVNFLVYDLRFYLEIDKFADSAEALAACNMPFKNEVAFLRKKAAIISKLFLNSDSPPKLRVNISEGERDLIWSLSSKGLLNRALYHRAKVIIFPIVMHFWRRFCTWKVMRSYKVSRKDSMPTSSPSTTISSKSSDICSPGNYTTIVFTLQKGIQVLLPQSLKKMESKQKKRDLDKSLQKGLSFEKSASCLKS